MLHCSAIVEFWRGRKKDRMANQWELAIRCSNTFYVTLCSNMCFKSVHLLYVNKICMYCGIEKEALIVPYSTPLGIITMSATQSKQYD